MEERKSRWASWITVGKCSLALRHQPMDRIMRMDSRPLRACYRRRQQRWEKLSPASVLGRQVLWTQFAANLGMWIFFPHGEGRTWCVIWNKIFRCEWRWRMTAMRLLWPRRGGAPEGTALG